MGEIRLRSIDFRRERSDQWRDLEKLLRRVEKSGLKSLTADELHRLPGLYRAAVSSLSVARAISLDQNLLSYLESLVSRAYFCVYGVKPRAKAVVRDYFLDTFPAMVRKYGLGILLAVAVMAAGMVVGLTLDDGEAYFIIMPEDVAQERTPTSTTEELREVLYSGSEHSDSELGFFATYLFTHNAKVALLSFALGFALGLPTVILLFYNGLILGTLAGLYASRGLSVEFWGWVLPHGFTELGAICLCGGAGLHLALAFIRPGRYGRIYGLTRAGRETAMIALGSVFMLLLAGLIEGFFRQLVHDTTVRYLLAAVTLLFWLAYFLFRGRERRKA
jgi:uncharacterized membrane protein SpoIIM required for sporulation